LEIRAPQDGDDDEQVEGERLPDDIELNDDDGEEQPAPFDDEDGQYLLRFLERSMRTYFREMEGETSGLRTTPHSAHLTIFKMCVSVLCTPELDYENGNGVSITLTHYAANYWLHHFLEVNLEKTSNDDVIRMVTSLAEIMSDTGGASWKIQIFSDNVYSKTIDTYTSRPEASRLNVLQLWVKRARELEEKFDPNMSSWLQKVSSDPSEIIRPLAKGHVVNWLCKTSSEIFYAVEAFRFAKDALELVRWLL
jgi:hypothetical protein